MVALEIFVKKGYSATKISDITKTAKISTGLLFHYFASKELLYIELVKMGFEGTKYPINKEYKEPIMFFEKFVYELFSVMATSPYVANMFVLMSQAQRSEGVPQKAQEIANTVDTIEAFVPIIKQGQKNKSIKKGNPYALSNAFWCSIQGIAEHYANNPALPLPDAEWIVDIIKEKKSGDN